MQVDKPAGATGSKNPVTPKTRALHCFPLSADDRSPFAKGTLVTLRSHSNTEDVLFLDPVLASIALVEEVNRHDFSERVEITLKSFRRPESWVLTRVAIREGINLSQISSVIHASTDEEISAHRNEVKNTEGRLSQKRGSVYTWTGNGRCRRASVSFWIADYY